MPEPVREDSGPEPVGSLAEEAVKLLRALKAQAPGSDAGGASSIDGAAGHAADRCPHGWCLACGVADLVADHPEVVERVADVVIDVARSVAEAAESAKRQWGAR